MTSPARFVKLAAAATGATALLLTGACSSTDSGDTTADTGSATSQAATDPTTGQTTAADTEQTAAWPRTIASVDGAGNPQDVTIEAEPTRIVSTSVTLTGALLAIDAPVVASGGTNPNTAVADGEGFFKQWTATAQQRGVESLYQGPEANIEAIAAAQPDLIIASAKGKDSAAKLYDKLSAIAPTVVIDYTKSSWQEITTELGEATGREKEARAALAKYNDRLEKVKASITLPPQPTDIITSLPNGNFNFLTDNHALGAVLSKIGFEIAVPPADLIAPNSQGKDRADVKGVAKENIDKALTGGTLFVLNVRGSEDPIAELKANPLLAGNALVTGDNAHVLNPEFFRIDYFSAMDLLDHIESLYATA
ncbi:Fe2+-enterobactin ABC transporter substrate-binding protein [Corynebacterium mendelii]|uniref:Fe2+-enterobactin ABC transporter substrate-binding protein n=1 Tax=Corynebacterium mendelii TaxID=2765362 RepID=A0A939E0V5_9CORY|nr:Fe2+-enterobactin ABC transporter substrate-binding protein [Corynebacterium mendelii]MBN9643666.1 Fe2+-enterobactin ABC transporter substrate-binding protein [Corynebacterium mendelii]